MALSVDADQLEIAALPHVISVTPIRSYETHAATQDEPGRVGEPRSGDRLRAGPTPPRSGYDGTGVKVAVLTRTSTSRTPTSAVPASRRSPTSASPPPPSPRPACAPSLFGQDAPKVKGGFDFVGEGWPNTTAPRTPTRSTRAPRPGHGTHVADIIGGRSADGAHEGIAPGASLYAVKVCSAVSTACNGVAMLLGMDWSLDPNGDGDISDAVDVVNMSLGSSYGQEQDDSTLAADNLVNAGVVVVVSAGNSADRPFIVGSPSSAAGTISVAQTALPDDLQWVIQPNTGPAITNAVLQSWSPAPTSAIAAGLARPAGPLGCTAGGLRRLPGRLGRAHLARHVQHL